MRFLMMFLLAGLVALTPADAQRRIGATRGGAQDEAYRAAQQGEILPLQQIRARVSVPGGQLIGIEFDGRIYRLKFMRGAEVIWIDVDARTGRVVGRH